MENMFLNLLQIVFCSIVLIYLGHSFWNYLKNTYTTPKTKDLIKMHTEKYKTMVEEISKNSIQKLEFENPEPNIGNFDYFSMQNDLDQFLDSQLQS